ncbi:MAG: histidine--tRNA ligase [Candidatus Treponema excrementipullorum]|nr:histidine--tRNA ligase [Candidatus Treponema excrementipullorum]
MESLIQPRILKGFRDFLPEAEITRSTLIEKLTDVFRSFGYVPIDTPVMEYSEILLRKSNGETEKQVFRFEDNGGRDVALRFDLTVPFARFTAEHKDELYFPFKRYHIAKVWRGEKPQAGRYREFIQCDFDCVGSDSASSDFEILSLMKAALQAIGVEDITIRMSHRGIFNQFLEKRNLTDKSEDILRTVDKLAKVGKEEVASQLESLTGSNTTAEEILEYITPADTFEQTLAHMEAMAGGESENTRRMREIYAMMEAAGIASSFVLDPSITRGLDYYTGIVYETFLNELPGIGSVCSGGRYDNLAGLYMKEKVPGVGSSIGLDRLIAGLQQLNKLESRKSFIDAEIFCLDKDMMTEYHRLAQTLRQRGVRCEVFPDPKKLLAQYTVAEKKGIPFGITLKKEDVAGNTVMIKNLATREVFENISLDKAIDILLRKN